jgi:hypothetical protein
MMAGETAGHEAYTSPEMRGVDFLTFALRPWQARVERAVSGLLPSTQTAKFNAGGFVRATLRDRYEAHRIAIEAELQVRDDGDGRTLFGPLVPWNVEARVLDRGRLVIEVFERGALAGTDRPRCRSPRSIPGTTRSCPSGSGSSWRNATTPPGERGRSAGPRSATRSWPWLPMAFRSRRPEPGRPPTAGSMTPWSVAVSLARWGHATRAHLHNREPSIYL